MSLYPRRPGAAAYQQTAVHGGVAAADPHRLVLMLMDGALERLAAAKGAIANGSMETKARMIQRTMAIVDELRSSLNLGAGGEIATNLDALYDYFGRQLVRANLENRAEPLDEVANLLREIRSAWILMPGAAARAATP